MINRPGSVITDVIPLKTMATKAQAEEWILDCDGSCRDVTFTPTTRDAATKFLIWMASNYRITSSNDNNGIDRSAQLSTDDPLTGIEGFIHIVYEGSADLIPNLQVFVDHDRETDEHCLEVTFFPKDVDRERFTLKSFLDLVDQWNAILQSDDYFVRYENASWNLYDGTDLGVICTRKTPPAG